jgi:hypothetical protein
MVRWNDPEPEVAVYHWSEMCYSLGSLGRSYGHGEEVTDMGIQYRGQIQTPHEKVVPHVILSHQAL